MAKKTSDELFIQTWNELQSASAVARRLDMNVRAVYKRRKGLEERIGTRLKANHPLSPTFLVREHAPRVDCELENGTIVVASDCHYWPGEISTAHRALVRLLPEINPSLVVMNGDLFDGAAISRFPKTAWIKLPTVKEELDAVRDRLHELTEAAPKATKFWWCLGNHDMRFEAKLAGQVSE